MQRAGVNWTPALLTGLKVWADGDVGSSSSWTDQSGQNDHLLQGTAGLQPTIISNAINGHKAFRFDGVDDFMQAAFTLGAVRFYHIVYKPITVQAFPGHFATLDAAAAGQALYGFSSTGTVNHFISESATLDAGAAPTAGTYIYVSTALNGASSYIRMGGSQIASGTVGSTSPSGLTVGAKSDGTAPTNIEVALIVVADTIPSGADLTSLEAYSKARYGL
jgi:hypothetical protein